jgi:hypothetical protein
LTMACLFLTWTGCHHNQSTYQLPWLNSSTARVPPPPTGSYAIPGQSYSGQLGGSPSPASPGTAAPVASTIPSSTAPAPPVAPNTVAPVAGIASGNPGSVNTAGYVWTEATSSVPLASNPNPTPASSSSTITATPLPWRAPGSSQ